MVSVQWREVELDLGNMALLIRANRMVCRRLGFAQTQSQYSLPSHLIALVLSNNRISELKKQFFFFFFFGLYKLKRPL